MLLILYMERASGMSGYQADLLMGEPVTADVAAKGGEVGPAAHMSVDCVPPRNSP